MQSKSLQVKGVESVATQERKSRRSRSDKSIAATDRRRRRGRSTKSIGNLGELEFMLAAANRGFPVGKPFGDDEAYDAWVDADGRVWRVQVKTATHYRNQTYALRSHWSGYRHLVPYTSADIDFLVGFIPEHHIWYIIPATAIQGRFTLNLYPFGARRSAAQFEKYREAWHLLTKRPRNSPKSQP
jgi:hypothetical protein